MSETDAGLSELPDGWMWTTLEEVSEINPRVDKQSIDDNLEVTFLPMKNVKELSGKIDLSETKRFSEVKRKSYTPFRDGDILFAKVTPCMENGKIAIAQGLKNGIGFGSTEFHVIRLLEKLSTPIIFFYLIQQKFRQEAQRAMTSAVGLLRVPTHYMRQIPIPLPPFSEQHRIVAKIEEVFTKLDAGIDALHKVQAQIKRYRQSVLKAAFEGKLTEAWRAEHQDEIEPVSPVASELPDGWMWTTLGELTEPSKEKVNPREIEEVPYISLEHIEKDTGRLLGHGNSSDVKSTKTKFNRGDLLYGRLRPYLNKVYMSEFDGICSTDMLVFSKNESVSNAFLLYLFLCRDFVRYASHNVSGVNLPRVNFQTLSQ